MIGAWECLFVGRWPKGQRGPEGVGVGNWQLGIRSWEFDCLIDGLLEPCQTEELAGRCYRPGYVVDGLPEGIEFRSHRLAEGDAGGAVCARMEWFSSRLREALKPPCG